MSRPVILRWIGQMLATHGSNHGIELFVIGLGVALLGASRRWVL